MKKALRRILSVFLWGVALIVAAAVIILAVNVDLTNPRDLDKFVQSKAEKAEIPGISIAFIKDGKLARSINYGYADIAEKKPVTGDTLFQIASVSKTITGTSVMQLVEQGRIDLDDNVNDYLPFRVEHPAFPGIPITFRRLLAHTSGIANNWDLYESLYTLENGGGDSPISLDEFTRNFLSRDGKWFSSKNFTPIDHGFRYNYSNPGYALLGYLVERITDTPFPDYCRKNIYEPLDMNSTRWLLKDTDRTRLAIPYSEKNEPLPNYSFPTYPDGALKTSTNEYSHFMIAMLQNGTYEEKSVLTSQTLSEMFQPQADDGKQALTWCYSLLEDLYMAGLPDAKLLGHTGADPGVFTLAAFNPEKKTGLIVFMNKEINMDLKTINTWLMVRRLIREAGLV